MGERYMVKEIFATLQGEGQFSGIPAVFVRFAACNLWSGNDEHRERDAERNGAKCPLFCDTDFVGGTGMTSVEVADRVHTVWTSASISQHPPLVVFTGGEPLLQLDLELVNEVSASMIAIETNGTQPLPAGLASRIDNVCVSPKVSDDKIVLRHGHELKVVFPAYDPRDYVALAMGFHHRFVSPEASVERRGKSLLNYDVMSKAAQFCIDHPMWRLSVQQHKVLGLP